MKFSKTRISALALLMLPFSVAWSQNNQTQEEINQASQQFTPIATGVSFLTVAPDARAGGLGDAGAATSPDLDSQYWNAAKFAFMNGVGGASVSYVPWLRNLVGGIDLVSASGYYKIHDVQAVAMSLRFFSMGDVLIRHDPNDPGYNVKPFDMALDASYSRKLTKDFSMGVVLRFVYSDLSGGNSEINEFDPGAGVGADISGYYGKEVDFAWGKGFGAFGFNISNIGSKIEYGDYRSSAFQPTNLRLGGSFKMPFDNYNSLTLSLDLNRLLVPMRPTQSSVEAKNTQMEDESPEDYSARISTAYQAALDEYYMMDPMTGIGRSFTDNPNGFVGELSEINFAIGLEYSYDDKFFGRFGYHNESEALGNRKYVTFGAGFKLNVFSLDVSYVLSVTDTNTNPLNKTLRFTLGFNMGAIKQLANNDAGKDSAEDVF